MTAAPDWHVVVEADPPLELLPTLVVPEPLFCAVKVPGVPVLLLIVPSVMSAQLEPALPVHVEPSDVVQVSCSPFTEMLPVAAPTPGPAS
jgi:hypothetical protein